MVSFYSSFVVFAFTLAVGVLAGVLIGRKYSANERRCRELEKELQANQQAQLQYSQQVTEHFNQTAIHMRNVSQSYYALCDHVATSAFTLCPEENLTGQLKQVFVPKELQDKSAKHDEIIETASEVANCDLEASVNETLVEPQPPKDFSDDSSEITADEAMVARERASKAAEEALL